MTDRAYIISRTLENKIAIAENNDQNTMIVTLDVLKEIFVLLKEQEEEIENLKQTAQSMIEGVCLLKERGSKTGHWVSVNDGDTVATDNDGCPERACYCSECQKYLIASDEYAVYGRYCPFCGAKMEGWLNKNE